MEECELNYFWRFSIYSDKYGKWCGH